MNNLTGKCLCGKIQYQITGTLGPVVNCHCSKCRRWHGAAFRTRSTIKRRQFKWISGEDFLSKYHSSEHVIKNFCKVCGSCLISEYDDDNEHIGLPIGGLDQDPGVRPVAHIFVASKSPWHEITDNLPQYAELPEPEVDAVLFKQQT